MRPEGRPSIRALAAGVALAAAVSTLESGCGPADRHEPDAAARPDLDLGTADTQYVVDSTGARLMIVINRPPGAIREVRPRVVLLTNIFRDQLDRYGEVHFIHERWREGLAALPSDSSLVLNADDPLVAALGAGRPGTVYFGLGDPELAGDRPPHASDARLCIRCGARLEVSVTFYGHLSYYRCPACGLARPEPERTPE